MPKHVYEGVIGEGYCKIDRDDGGQALIAEMSDDSCMFVRLQSWDEQMQHEEFNLYRGKRVRITVETLD